MVNFAQNIYLTPEIGGLLRILFVNNLECAHKAVFPSLGFAYNGEGAFAEKAADTVPFLYALGKSLLGICPLGIGVGPMSTLSLGLWIFILTTVFSRGARHVVVRSTGTCALRHCLVAMCPACLSLSFFFFFFFATPRTLRTFLSSLYARRSRRDPKQYSALEPNLIRVQFPHRARGVTSLHFSRERD